MINFLKSVCADDLRLQIVTIATEETDGYHRFMRSVRLFDLNVEVMFNGNGTTGFCSDWSNMDKSLSQVVGMGEQWRGGDVVRYPGGGQKVNLLRPVLEQWKNQHSTVVMFVDR